MRSQFAFATGEQIFQARCHRVHETMPTFMAMYGQQHMLNRETLESKGFFGSFLIDYQQRTRLMHPLEVALTHLVHGRIFVSNDFKRTWHHLGNQITWPHALFMMVNALNQFRSQQPKLSMNSFFEKMMDCHMRISRTISVTGQNGTIFADLTEVLSDPETALRHYGDLCHEDLAFWLPANHVWTPSQGVFALDVQMAQNDLILASPLSRATELDDDAIEFSPTLTFQPLLKAKMIHHNHCMTFWIDPEIPIWDLEQLFGFQFQVKELSHQSDGCTYEFRMSNIMCIPDPTNRGNVILCIHEGNVMFIQIDSKQALMKQIEDRKWTNLKFDQFGSIMPTQKHGDALVITDFPIKHQSFESSGTFLLAAFQAVQHSAVNHHQDGTFDIEVTGPATAREIVTAFWKTAFDPATLQDLKCIVRCTDASDCTRISFASETGCRGIPSQILAECLMIAATRKALDTMTHEHGHDVLIKWGSRPLWKGCLHAETNVLTVLAFLPFTCWPLFQGKELCLIHQSKRCCNVLVGDLQNSTTGIVLMHMVVQMSGGVGAKETQRVHIRNSLASTLLEMGYPIDWVSEATEQVLNHAGLKKSTNTSLLPPGKQRADAVLQLCRDCAVAIPEKITKAATKVTQAGETMQRKKRQTITINPNDYTIEPGFLRSQVDEAMLQIPEIRHQEMGVMLTTVDHANQWASESQTISQRELALLIVGEHKLDTTLTFSHVHVPCKDRNQRPVILACTMLQMGAKAVKIQEASHPPIAEHDMTTVSITYWSQDWNEDWKMIMDNPYLFTKRTLKTQGLDEIIESLWGKSVKETKSTQTTQFSESIQIHGTVKTSRLPELLCRSGFNRMFIVPKAPDGRISPEWKIIWLDATFAQISSIAAEHPTCLGLVRNRNSLGLRFSRSTFEEAWKSIQPNKPMPVIMDLKYMWKIQPLPFGCTATMLVNWAKAIAWELKPIKALGATTWLAGSQEPLPEGIHTFNSRPLLIKLLPPRHQQNMSPIVAGPRPFRQPRPGSQKEEDQNAAFFDPWANYSGPKPSQSGRNAAPISASAETKFQEQEARITKVEEALAQLRTDTGAAFQKVEEREKITHERTQEAIAAVKSDLEASFQNAIAQQSNQLNSTLNDLKALLTAKPKRVRDHEEGGMQD